MSVAFLFPGQGSQSAGFLHRLPQHPAVQCTLAEAAAHLHSNPLALDSSDALQSTVATQLSTLIAGVATARALVADGVLPECVAGHSIGAFAAAVAAEALDFVDALRLVRVRAQSMQDAYPCGYGMAAVVGLSEPEVQRIVASSVGSTWPIYLAAINAPRQFVISGRHASLEIALHSAKSAGASKAIILEVPVPSHCELMNAVSDAIRLQLQSIELAEPRVRYVCNHTARAVLRAEDIREDLIRGVANPVLWHDCTTVMTELGTRLFVELPPGRALADLARLAFPHVRALAVGESAYESVSLLASRMVRADQY